MPSHELPVVAQQSSVSRRLLDPLQVLLAQTGVVQVRLRSPMQLPSARRQPPKAGQLSGPQTIPSRLGRAQSLLLVVVPVPEHDPLLQMGSVQVSVSVPVASQVSSNPPHGPSLQLRDPQLTPSVLGPLQFSDWTTFSVPEQLPLEQTDWVHVRERVPVSSHTPPVKPLHAGYAGQLGPPPQLMPSVPRVQGSGFEKSSGVQLPLRHTLRVHVLGRVPVVSQVLSKPPQEPVAAPQVSAAHVLFSVVRLQPVVSVTMLSVGSQTPPATHA